MPTLLRGVYGNPKELYWMNQSLQVVALCWLLSIKSVIIRCSSIVYFTATSWFQISNKYAGI